MLFTRTFSGWLLGVVVLPAVAEVDLARRYPTSLGGGDLRPDHAREWRFTADDVYLLNGFDLRFGGHGRVVLDRATLGVGHCVDGAVWAAIVPDEPGGLQRDGQEGVEGIAHIWLRFHPRLIGELFPPSTVAETNGDGPRSLIRRIADAKFASSWHAGARATIPPPAIITLDLDTPGRQRRFFVIDRAEQTNRYVAAFENRAMGRSPRFSITDATAAFDGIWSAFDRDYAMFGIRPDVDWEALRAQYRPRALACGSTDEFARVCAEMLRQLRDLHVTVTVSGTPLPGFRRPLLVNANPKALPVLLPGIRRAGRDVYWAVTHQRIGYLAISSWSDAATPALVDKVLEEMRDTRGLVLDVRMNAGGSENRARSVAARFIPQRQVYARHQLRNGPARTDLGPKRAREIRSRGPWRYERPVLLLIGQGCMSSNEAFVLMMKGAPNVTTLGDRTRGSSGNPRQHKLPLGIAVNVPRWLALTPAGEPFDEVGIQPDVRFENRPEAFSGNRDDLLSAALKRIAENPLPPSSQRGN